MHELQNLRGTSDTAEETTNYEFPDRSEGEKIRDTSLTDKIIEVNVEGRRIVDVGFLWREIAKNFVNHRCPLTYLKIDKCIDRGLRAQLFYSCEQCDFSDSLWTGCNEDVTMGITESVVCGTITSGIGYATLQEVLAAMGVPYLSPSTYRKYRDRLFEGFLLVSDDDTKNAAKLEEAIAREKRNVVSGIACIAVTADGAWAKRSYTGGKHDSLSGVGVVIGYETGLVLNIGVRNKYCSYEAKAEQLGTEVTPHVCFKNWGYDQSSNAMEKSIIVEAFEDSVQKHGLIYKTLIADGDASTYQAIRDANPYAAYNVQVLKLECSNHLFRNMCTKIRVASKMTISRNIAVKLTMAVTGFRLHIEKSAFKIRRCVELARDYRKTEDLSTSEKCRKLEKDIFVIFEHAFGDHAACDTIPFVCNRKDGDKNLLPDLRTTGIYESVYEAIRYLSGHANSLLENVTNNIAEACNSIVNKCNAGKRTFQCARNSYEMRCLAAAVQHNTQRVLSKVHSGMGKIVPTSVKKLESSRQLHVRRNKTLRNEKGKRTRRKKPGTDKDYGPNAQKPDLPYCTYQMVEDKHLENLKRNQENRVQIERDTRSQRDCELWHNQRIDIITASHFGDICRMRKTTSCASLVTRIRYLTVLNSAAIRFGVSNEQTAIKALELELGVKIKRCGLFIDPEIPYLGASPDGIIEPDGIVEIKCPFSAKDLSVEEAIACLPRLKRIFTGANLHVMNKNHPYYYQVVGQLRATGFKYCIFALWTPVNIKYVKVERDDEFWRSKMEPFLIRFYMECLLPEIVDGRRKRSMPIREPGYILQAKQGSKGQEKVISEANLKRGHQESSKKRVKRRRQVYRRNDTSSEGDNAENYDGPQLLANEHSLTESQHVPYVDLHTAETAATLQLGATKNQVLELSPDEVSSKMTFPPNPTERIFSRFEEKSVPFPEPDVCRNDIQERFFDRALDFPKMLIEHSDVIAESSLQTLAPGVWLDDNVINTFFTAVDAISQNNNLKAISFDTCFWEKLMQTGNLSLGFNNWVNRCTPWKYDVWFMPVNVSGIHWALLIVIFDQQVFLYLDSQHLAPPTLMINRLCLFIEAYCMPRWQKPPCRWDQWLISAPTDIPKQRTVKGKGGNCGVYVCMWGYLISSSSYAKFTEDDMNCARKGIACFLLQSGLIKNNRQRAHERELLYEANIDNESADHIRDIRISRSPPSTCSTTLEYCASLASVLDQQKRCHPIR